MGGIYILGGLVFVGVLVGVILVFLGVMYLIVIDNQQDDGENDKVDDEEGDMVGKEEEDESVSDSDGDGDYFLWQRVKFFVLDVFVLSVN